MCYAESVKACAQCGSELPGTTKSTRRTRRDRKTCSLACRIAACRERKLQVKAPPPPAPAPPVAPSDPAPAPPPPSAAPPPALQCPACSNPVRLPPHAAERLACPHCGAQLRAKKERRAENLPASR